MQTLDIDQLDHVNGGVEQWKSRSEMFHGAIHDKLRGRNLQIDNMQFSGSRGHADVTNSDTGVKGGCTAWVWQGLQHNKGWNGVDGPYCSRNLF